jgi:hypothetical protein
MSLTWLLLVVVVLAQRSLLKLLLVVLLVLPMVLQLVVAIVTIAAAAIAMKFRLLLLLGLVARSAIVFGVSITQPLRGPDGEALVAVVVVAEVEGVSDKGGVCLLVAFFFEGFAADTWAEAVAVLTVAGPVSGSEILVAVVGAAVTEEVVWEVVPVLLAMREAFDPCLVFLLRGICIPLFGGC